MSRRESRYQGDGTGWILLALFIVVSFASYCAKIHDCRTFKHDARGYVGINNCGDPQ